MSPANENFPFSLEEITAWIVRRKDGTVVRYALVDQNKLATSKPEPARTSYTPSVRKSFSDYCSHAPDPAGLPPIFSNGKINLYIADYQGARKNHTLFDVCIDGGNVLEVAGEYSLPNAYGDPKLCSSLARHVVQDKTKPSSEDRILKIRWADRCAPPVWPSFWPALLKELEKIQEKKGSPLNVLTICQGGHGRSGSALVALMMCMTKYSPLDALTHIRALHCARAIESKDQHVYLNLVAKELGREENALEAESVASFKDRFLNGNFPDVYKERIKGGQGAGSRQREAGYL